MNATACNLDHLFYRKKRTRRKLSVSGEENEFITRVAYAEGDTSYEAGIKTTNLEKKRGHKLIRDVSTSRGEGRT